LKRFLLFLLFPFALFALYNGNPSFPMMPEIGIWIPKESPVGLKVGYEVDWSYDTNLKAVNGYNSLTQFGVVTFNILDRVELFTDLGAFSASWYQGDSVFYQSDTSWMWGVGGRAILAYWGDLQLSGGASYVDSSPSSVTVHSEGEKFSAHFNAWQIAGGLTYRFGWFYPYVGVDYLNMTWDAGKKKLYLQMHDPFGIYLGLGVGLERGWNFNLEARFINENAITFSTDIRF
jgi:hypothetical protein